MDKEDLKNNLLMIARVGLSGAILLIIMVAGLVLSKKLTPGLNPFLVLAAAVGSAVGTFIVFPKVVQRLGIAGPDFDRTAMTEDFSVPETAVPRMLQNSGISIDSVHFGDMPGLHLVGKDDTTAQWQTSEGDIVFMRFIPEPPKKPLPLNNLEGLREQYKKIAAQRRAAMIELNIVPYSSIPCMEMISKTKMQPHGMTYAAAASLLLADFSFNIAFYSPERGMTGFRDALVASKFMDKYPSTQEFDAVFYDRSSNPEAAQRNRSDDECYDADFPDHPLSRCRKFLRDLRAHIVLAPEVRNAKSFSA